jgi:hypothetical protein
MAVHPLLFTRFDRIFKTDLQSSDTSNKSLPAADIKSKLLTDIASERIAYRLPKSKLTASAQSDGRERQLASIHRHQNVPNSSINRPING